MRASFALAAALLASCSRSADVAPRPEPVASAVPVGSTSAAPTAASSVGPPPPVAQVEAPIPHFVFASRSVGANVLARIEGALAVSDGKRVGRVVGEEIEWAPGEVPKTMMYGGFSIDAIHGRWPDAVGIVYSSGFGRVPMPTYGPLSGKGVSHTAAPGGGAGWIAGEATLGGSTVVASWDYAAGFQLVTVRGPKLAREPMAELDAGCKPDAPLHIRGFTVDALGATRAGTLLAFGSVCSKASVQVWDAKGKARLVDLSRWLKTSTRGASVVAGEGDELWYFSGTEQGVILRCKDGAFEPFAGPGPHVRNLFASETGQLHVSAGRGLHKLEAGKWTLVGHLAFPTTFPSIGVEKEVLWAIGEAGVRKLVPGESIAFREGCKTPLVHLSDISDKAPPRYTFPATQKVLAAFPGAKDLSLVEFSEAGTRRLGAVVKDGAQGEALVAHVRANVKEDDPALLCFSPKSRREIPVTAKP